MTTSIPWDWLSKDETLEQLGIAPALLDELIRDRLILPVCGPPVCIHDVSWFDPDDVCTLKTAMARDPELWKPATGSS